MFNIRESQMGSRSEDVGDSPVRISVHSNGDSVRENVSPLFNIGASGVSHTAEQTLRSGRPSIFALRSSGYGPSQSLKPPIFDNDPFKYLYFKNKLHHYLLMLGIYFAISKLDITDQENMDLYLVITSCLTDQSLDLV